MIRVEEHLRAVVHTIPTERVRMEKVIVPEGKPITVTVRREEFRLVREGIDPSPGGVGAPVQRTPDEFYSMVPREERIVVTKTIAPIEKVTLIRETIAEQQEFTDTIRREQIEVDQSPSIPPIR